MRKASFALGAFVILTGSIAADTPGTAPQLSFMSPLGNIGCVYRPAEASRAGRPQGEVAELTCERMGQNYVRVVMGATEAPRILQEPAAAASARAAARLAYGGVWIGGPFACESQISGVTCTRSDGRKISLSQRHATVK
jgi:hypothetical protein